MMLPFVNSFTECTGVDTTWKQAQLSLHRGGFGLQSLVHHSPAAYTASWCNSIDELPLNHHLADAISQFNSHLSPFEALPFSSLCTHTPSQKDLSDQFSSLLDSSTWSDRARLMSVTSPHAAAWISVIPSIGQGLHLLPNEFQVAVQWWLGINPSSSQDGTQLVCPFCPSKSLDTLGHHCVTCRCGGDVMTRTMP